jgi:hypothetical protein
VNDEIERLRALVGPSEVGYEQLRDDRDRAEAVAREATHEAGELRGRIEEMSVQLSRARQDQDLLQRRVAMSVPELFTDLVRHRWTVTVRPRLGRVRRRIQRRRGPASRP